MFKDTIEVNGRLYELQHPGVEEWLKLQSSLFKTDGTFDMVPLLKYSFEHVVIPAEGGKLSIDGPLDSNNKPQILDKAATKAWLSELQDVWIVVLPRFCKGDLEENFVYPDNKPGSAGRNTKV